MGSLYLYLFSICLKWKILNQNLEICLYLTIHYKFIKFYDIKKISNVVLPVIWKYTWKNYSKIFKPKSKVRKMISIHYGVQSDELEI